MPSSNIVPLPERMKNRLLVDFLVELYKILNFTYYRLIAGIVILLVLVVFVIIYDLYF